MPETLQSRVVNVVILGLYCVHFQLLDRDYSWLRQRIFF